MKHLIKILQFALVGFVSAGWILPAIASTAWFFDSQIILASQGNELQSFPFLKKAKDLMIISGIWLFLAMFLWSGLLFKRHKRN
jgi:hypothetical protein